MNRHDRRAADSRARQVNKADQVIKNNQDTAMTKEQHFAMLIQDGIHKSIGTALRSCGKGGEASGGDLALIVTALLSTAAGLSCQVGVDEDGFADAARLMMKQLREALAQEPAEAKSPLILP